jgi:hypothetical protein
VDLHFRGTYASKRPERRGVVGDGGKGRRERERNVGVACERTHHVYMDGSDVLDAVVESISTNFSECFPCRGDSWPFVRCGV